MGGACSTHGGDEKHKQNCGRKNLHGRHRLEALSVDGWVTSECISGK